MDSNFRGVCKNDPEPTRNANKIVGTQVLWLLRLPLLLFLLLWGPHNRPLSSQLRAPHADSWGAAGTHRHLQALRTPAATAKAEKK